MPNKRTDNKTKLRLILHPGCSCEQCIKVASYGAVYGEEINPHGKNNLNCGCEMLPSVGDGIDVEGHDTKLIRRTSEKLDKLAERSDLTEKQYEALKMCIVDANMPESNETVSLSLDIADSLNKALTEAFTAYNEEKTIENYKHTIAKLLKEIGNIYNTEIIGEFPIGGEEPAHPDGNEVWAAVHVFKNRKIEFLGKPEYGKLSPDLLVDGEYFDIKTPEKERKVRKRISHGVKQCKERKQEYGNIVFSLLRYEEDETKAVEIAKDFLLDGSVKTLYVVEKLGDYRKI